MIAVLQWLLDMDLGAILSHGDWHVRFVGEYNNYVKFAMMAVLAGLVYLTIRTYRREGLAPARAKAALAAIRIAVVLLVTAVIFQPAVVLRYVKTLTSAVVLLVDDSQSMSFQDSYGDANVAQLRRRLAQAAGVEESQIPRMSRGELLQKILTRQDGPIARLAADHPLVVLRYSTTQPASAGKGGYTQELATIDAVVPGGAAQGSPEAAAKLHEALKGLTRSGYISNLPAAIRDALDLTQGQRAPIILHFSDGELTAQGGESRINGAIAYVRERGVQVYSVVVGDPTPPRNVSVTALQAPREVRRGSNVEFVAVLTHRNMGSEQVTVRLQRRRMKEPVWTETGVSQAVALESAADANGASQNLQSVVLHLEPMDLGEFEYRAVADPVPGEQNIADNSAVAQVSVADEKIRVLLISSGASWEFQYLRNFFIQQPDLYRASVWQQNADKDINQAASTGMKLFHLPRSLDELIGVPGDPNKPGYNVVILYDPEYTEGGFDETFAKDLLLPFVQKHGGGLCYIAGGKNTDSLLQADQKLQALADMLPVTLDGNPMVEIARIGEDRPQAWQARLTSYGLDHPVMRLGGDAEESRRIWEILPGLHWSQAVKKPKPGAACWPRTPIRFAA